MTPHTLTIEIPIKATLFEIVEIEVPFFGKEPDEPDYIFIDTWHKLVRVQLLPLTKSLIVEEYHEQEKWQAKINISEYVPIPFQEWDHLLIDILDRLEGFVFNISDEDRHVQSNDLKEVIPSSN